MFTGIVENLGTVCQTEKENSNLHIWVSCEFLHELKIDQSIAHNGVCLTVVEIQDDQYKVTAIDETLQKTNLGELKKGDKINLERCMKLGARLDGHIVQGHVDQKGVVQNLENKNGSYLITIDYNEGISGNVTVEKGSICVNGVSLTIVESNIGRFSVAIIPYTWENTNLSQLQTGNFVNLEFDILGKYVQRLMNH